MALSPPSVHFTIANNGPAEIVDAWNGFALDPRTATVYSVANGGHNDWPGNEVFTLRLTDAAPHWVEELASSPQSQVVRDQPHYLDGTPTSRHSFYGVDFSVPRNRVLLWTGYMYGNGNLMRAADGYDIAAKRYDAAATYPDVPSALSGLPGAPFVMTTPGDVVGFGAYEVQVWHTTTNTWESKLTNQPLNGQSAAAAFDSKRNRVLVVGGDRASGSAVGYLYSLADATLKAVTFSGLSESGLDGSECAMVYGADRFLFTCGAAGGAVLAVDPVTFAITQYATIPSAAGATNGVWKRWLWAPSLGGIVYVPSAASNAFFLRVQ